jgi:diadenosine tetraphosphate (Ap4A) HIT family hydrolase
MPLVGWVWTINLTSRAIDNVYSDDSIAGCHFQAEPGQAVAHYLDIHFVADFSSKAGPFVPGANTPRSLPPEELGQRLLKIARQVKLFQPEI